VHAGAPSSTTPELLREKVAAERHGRSLETLALPVIMLVGAANFLWQLGSSSFFVDEALSVQHSVPSISNLIHSVRMYETTPWTYFIGLHEWLGRTGSQTEWVVRLPSVVAGVALVAAAYWMAGAFVERRAALAAAALCALTPLVLQYAQQARVYIFAMLAATVAVAATVRGARPDAQRRIGLLVVGAASAILALWLHYTATLVILPLCVWLALQQMLPSRARIAFLGSCLIAELLLIPLFIDQYNAAPNGGIGPFAALKFSTAMSVLGTPLNGRFALSNFLLIVAAATTSFSILLVALRPRASRDPLLLASLAALTPIVLIVAGVAGKDVVVTRYSAIATPFMLTAIAGAVVSAPRPAAIAIALATCALGLSGLINSHRRLNFYVPAREAIEYLHTSANRGVPILLPSKPVADIPLQYYAEQRLHPLPGQLVSGAKPAAVRALLRQHHKQLWIIAQYLSQNFRRSQLLALASRVLSRFGYRPVSVRTFRTSFTFAVYRVVALGKAGR
jgi:Dolichyl-phosphate-mannose-protein mannosyltransferase